MKRYMPFVILFALAALPRPSMAQENPPPTPAQAAPVGSALVPLQLEVVVSRYQGEKKVSSLPFLLAVNANAPGHSSLRMGADVPVPSLVFGPKGSDGSMGPMAGPATYRSIGTNIDSNAKTIDAGRFQVWVSVEDSSAYTNVKDETTPTVDKMPVFRTFKSSNTLVLRDGQSQQFTAATDRVNGEVVKIDVTLRVVK